MKLKFLSNLDVTLSALFLLTQVLLIVFVYPKLFTIYQEADVYVPATAKYAPIISATFLLIYLYFLIAALRLQRRPDKTLYLTSIMACVFMILFTGYIIGVSMASTIQPIYNLTSGMGY